jgi:hypothetical protein
MSDAPKKRLGNKLAVACAGLVAVAMAFSVLYFKHGGMPPVKVTRIKTVAPDEVSPKLRVVYGKSVDLKGNAIGISDVLFAPAAIELEGNGFEATNGFAEYALRQAVSQTLGEAIDRGCDAVWIKGRLQKAFGLKFMPADSGCEKSFSDRPFVALIPAPDGGFDGIPFQCIDHYGDTELMFSQHQPPVELRERIAVAFWDLILNDQAAIADYSDVMYHSGGGKEFRFGVKNGVIFIDEAWNELAKERRSAR